MILQLRISLNKAIYLLLRRLGTIRTVSDLYIKAVLFKQLLIILILFNPSAQAFDWSLKGWTWSVSPGIGGTGIQKTVQQNGSQVDVSRGETPGMIGVEISKMTSDQWSFSIGHRRGFRLGPFSSGVGFTAVSWNWYYLGAPPMPISVEAESYVTEDGWAPYVGLSTGLAQGTISREADEVSSVTASGAFVGIRLGADYRYTPDLVLRPEIIGSQSFFNSSNLQSTLSEFGIMCGFVFAIK